MSDRGSIRFLREATTAGIPLLIAGTIYVVESGISQTGAELHTVDFALKGIPDNWRRMLASTPCPALHSRLGWSSCPTLHGGSSTGSRGRRAGRPRSHAGKAPTSMMS
jgi:hypothetical protein